MPKTITQRFSLHVADTFRSSVITGSDNFYVFYSRVHSWPDDTQPPVPNNSIQYTDFDVWKHMIGFKKISNNDVSYAISRYNWANGTVYSQYSHVDTELLEKVYYVYTEAGNVYKCLSNNKGSPSVHEPLGDSTSIIATDDGYRWKFMYTVTPAEMSKFQTLYYIPAKLTASNTTPQGLVQAAAANGSIDIIDVVNDGGSDYLYNAGTFAGITNTSVMFIANTASNSDSVYDNYSLYIDSGKGTGQIRTISSYSATDKKVTLSTGFAVAANTTSTYRIAPKINITGDGTGALAHADVTNGAISRINVINSGSNYAQADATVTDYGVYGTGATLIPYLSPPGGHGSNPVRELAGRSISLNVLMDGSENNKIVANNQFRIYGLMKNPVERSTGERGSATRYDQTYRLNLTAAPTGDFLQDEFVSGNESSAIGRVVAYDSNTLFLTTVSGNFSTSEIVTANTSGATATVNTITYPELLPYRGEVLYMVNQAPLSRDVDQTENITITVKF